PADTVIVAFDKVTSLPVPASLQVGTGIYLAYLDNTICHSMVTLVILEALIARPHVVFVPFAGMACRIASYPCHILIISKLPE
ncbi:MAG: hypothetical protein O6949_09390, partial [Chloroflexi bacterium]|nr:hypothetical protein [Chloroflexota bacterium]